MVGPGDVSTLVKVKIREGRIFRSHTGQSGPEASSVWGRGAP